MAKSIKELPIIKSDVDYRLIDYMELVKYYRTINHIESNFEFLGIRDNYMYKITAKDMIDYLPSNFEELNCDDKWTVVKVGVVIYRIKTKRIYDYIKHMMFV